MTDRTLIPSSPSEDDYVRQVAAAEPPPLLAEKDPIVLFQEWLKEVRPAAPVSWPRRVGFALRLALELPLMSGYLALVRPGQLRARHSDELAARSGEG